MLLSRLCTSTTVLPAFITTVLSDTPACLPLCDKHCLSGMMPPPAHPCPSCSECDLALDVYQQLLADGCTPNLVTFNILIDIHGKSGQWARAVEVLDQLQAQVGQRNGV